MPTSAQHSSSESFLRFKHPQLASIAQLVQPHMAPLTEHPDVSLGEPPPVAGSTGGRRAPVARWQDKAAPEAAPRGLAEPAPGTNGERRSHASGIPVSSARASDGLKRTERLTLRVRPGVKSTLQRLATKDKISLSEASANGLEDFARAKIHEQEETLFEPRMHAMLRREIRASDDRRVPFEIRTAIAAEHTRLIEADLYARQLRREGVPLPAIKEKLKSMYRQARANVLKKTPQMQTILAQWWQEPPEAATEQSDDGGGAEGAR